MTYRDDVIADAPLAYWRLGEVGGLAADEMPGLRTLTHTGVTTGQTGLLVGDANQAVLYAGTITSYSLRNPISGMPTTNLTIECLVKLTDTTKTDATILSYRAGAIDEFSIGNYSNLSFIVRGIAVGGSGAILNDGVAHHVVLTWRSSDGRAQYWVDGLLKATRFGIATGQSIVDGGAFVLAQEQDSVGGTFDVNQAWPGLIDEVAIYTTVLSDNKIKNHYAAAFVNTPQPFIRSVVQPNLVANVLRVSFSEDMTNLSTFSNFTFVPALTVTASVPGSPPTFTDLTVTGLVPGTSYLLTVSSPPVQDTYGNNLSFNQIAFQAVGSADVIGEADGGDLDVVVPSDLIGGPGPSGGLFGGPGDGVESTQFGGSEPASPRINQLCQVNFTMRAYRALSPGFVFWTVADNPDFAANLAPYPAVELADILIEQTFFQQAPIP